MSYAKKFSSYATTLALLIAFVCTIAAPVAVQAQAAVTRPPLSLTTSPIPLNIVTQPGKTVTADLRVKNNGTTPEKLKIELLKFAANGESGNPQLHEREAKDTYFDWVSFSEQTFVAEPGIWKTVKMTIKTPDSAAFGYYLAALFSRATPDKPTGGASAVEGGVASLVLLDVEAPGASREAKVQNLTADRKVYEFLPANLTVRLKNSGNVHVAPAGSVFIKRGDKQIAVLDFNTQRGNILPGTTRKFDVSWNDGFPYFDVKTEGTKTTRTLKWNFENLSKFRIGHYTATLVAVYDDGQRDIPIEATVGFWVIPWRILGVVLLILLLIGAGVWMIVRGIWKNVRRRPTDNSGPPTASGAAVAASEATAEVGKPAEASVEAAAEPPAAPTEPKVESAPVASSASEPHQLADTPTTPEAALSAPTLPADDSTPAAPVQESSSKTPASGTSNAKSTPKTAPELKD